MTLTSVTNPKETLISEVRAEYERIGVRLRELQSLIEQSRFEVEQLQKRSITLTAQVKRVEERLEELPRVDIKATYTAVIDLRTRLLTMQNQLDKVQQDRTQLETFSQLLKRVLDLLEGVTLPTANSGRGGNGSAARQNEPLSNTTIIRIVEAQEAERQRLARQMHDGPAQSLTNFILQAEICQRLFDRDPDRALEELGNLKTSASSTFQKVRDFIFDLRPMMLDDLGLAPTIRRYVEAFGGKSNIELHLNIVGEERRRLEAHAEVTMFRTVQELLGYARDQCVATKLDLILDISTDQVKAILTFNGKPLNETEAGSESGSVKSFSLHTLRERLELVGGTLELSGEEGNDNRVEIALPAHDRT
jgi:two-component system sensor histidine kinase DegS